MIDEEHTFRFKQLPDGLPSLPLCVGDASRLVALLLVRAGDQV